MSELPRKWLTVDIGESTGYSVWSENRYVCGGTAPMEDFVFAAGDALMPGRRHRDTELLSRVSGWELIVIEDWQLYPDKALALSWDKQLTVRGLGALQFIAMALERPCVLQPAAIKNSAVQAGAEELFVRPVHDNRHQNDSIMHGVRYLATQGEGVAQQA
jgi:hypothetical protein